MQLARIANASSHWDGVWANDQTSDWRATALADVYDRICALTPKRSIVVDIGGGIGALGAQVKERCEAHVVVVDHSRVARIKSAERGLDAHEADLEDLQAPLPRGSVVIATEVLEHLSQPARDRIYALARTGGSGLFSIPNNRLGPDEEPEHTRKWNAKQFLDELRGHFGSACRVEAMGAYLLGVCGSIAQKEFTLSVCLPVRDEATDLEATLSSFRGVADELVVGVDPRTVDDTAKIAAEYADLVFEIDNPTGPHQDEVPADGVHFAHIRNQCIERCSCQWIFMTEGHERLYKGQDVLLRLSDVIPEQARMGYVYREGNRQRWAYPWLFRNDPSFRFSRATHNVLDYPTGTYAVRLPQVSTLHERAPEKDIVRQKQRKRQNRTTLMRDWLRYDNENSLHYLGAEWREHNTDKAIEWLRVALREGRRNGPRRYHTRLLLAKELVSRNGNGDEEEARSVLINAAADDWSRAEHWVWLGDLAFDKEDFEEALQFYRYASTTIENPPFTLWWIDLAYYGWVPAQRLAMTYGALGKGPEALFWARRVVDLLPDEQQDALEEARRNVTQIEEAIAQ